MITLNQISTDALADFLGTLTDLSYESRHAIADFIDECWSDGIDLDRLRLIVQEAREYDDMEQVADCYFSDDEIDELKEQAREDGDEDDWTDLAKEKIQDAYSATILPAAQGTYVVIE